MEVTSPALFEKSPAHPSRAIGVTWGIRGLPGLAKFLGCPVGGARTYSQREGGQVVLAWGRRPTARKAEVFARRHDVPLWRLEDGFLRSVELGRMDSPLVVVLRSCGWGRGDAPLAIVVDSLGIHYDAGAPSLLETQVGRVLEDRAILRTRALIRGWRAGRVSKYNYAREYAGKLPAPYVLVADQTAGDPSIRYGLAGPEHFHRMLEAALTENPEATIVLKVHPEVFAGRKRGHFDLAAVSENPRVLVLGENVHPTALLENAEAVYAVTSQIGFEGLLWGKEVHTFGMPFYAGWGLTADALPAPDRRRPVPLENLVHAALIDYSRYLDPETGQPCEVERVLDWMSLQRKMRERFPSTVYACGFSPWKKPIVADYLAGSRVEFVERVDQIPTGATLALWGRKPVEGRMPEGVRTVCLEDGFLRSVGLGADLVRPLSWVMDNRGIYYDATEPSELENLLQTADFPEPLRDRATALRGRIVRDGITKYNVGLKPWKRPAGAKRVILVPGQVESDASIRLGAPKIRANLDLLRAVRESQPEAYIVYKPHPDVIAGLRLQGQGEDQARDWCDEVVIDVPMGGPLPRVDEVHVLTSLAGFEALLRSKRVVCYGHPFYSGWGLTIDRVPPARRTRTLGLEELIAGALILYPAYVSRTTGRFTTPERALDELLAWQAETKSPKTLGQRLLRYLLRLRAN